VSTADAVKQKAFVQLLLLGLVHELPHSLEAQPVGKLPNFIQHAAYD